MNQISPPPIDRTRHNALLAVIAIALLATVGAWYVMARRGPLSPTLTAVQAVTAVVLSALLVIAWWKLLPQRGLELICLLYVVGIGLVCMALRLYSPRYGAGIHLQPLYLWIPLIYLFAFMLTDHTAGLVLSVCIWVLFAGVSLPYVIHDLDGPYANFTLQLNVVTAATIVLLYFFSSYQYRLRLAQATVDQLARLSDTDDLTGLPNRRHMAKALRAELANRHGKGLAVLLFDIDRFKNVNDELGHGAGDATLTALATRVTQTLRGGDRLGRWGGDEFLALVSATGPEAAVRKAQALCDHVAATPLFGTRQVTISCGVTVTREDDNVDSLLQRADAALYAAKRAGRNRAEGILEG